LPVVLRADGLAEARSTHAVHLESAPMLGVDLTAHDDPIAVGSETTYEVRVFNQGPVAGQAIRLVALFPDTLLPVHAGGPAAHRRDGQAVTFEAVPQLGPRSEVVYQLRARGLKPGLGRLRVEVQASELARPLVQEATVHVRPASPAPRP